MTHWHLSYHFMSQSSHQMLLNYFQLTKRIFFQLLHFLYNHGRWAKTFSYLQSRDGRRQTPTHPINHLASVLVSVLSSMFRSWRGRSWSNEEAWSFYKKKGRRRIQKGSHHHISFCNTFVRLLPHDCLPCLLFPALSSFLGFSTVKSGLLFFTFSTRIVVVDSS